MRPRTECLLITFFNFICLASIVRRALHDGKVYPSFLLLGILFLFQLAFVLWHLTLRNRALAMEKLPWYVRRGFITVLIPMIVAFL